MVALYYVEPDYWLEGYAVGDALSASCQIDAASTVSTNARRLRAVGGTASPVSSAISAADRVRIGSAGASASLSVVPAANVVRNCSAVASVSSATIAAAVAVYEVGAVTDATTAVASDCVRVRFSGATASAALSFTANAIEKWEQLPPTPETWIAAGASGGFWSPVAPSGKTWQDAL